MATATLLPDPGHHHSQGTPNHAKQKCTSATCCSPSRLWRSIQQLIGQNNKQDLIKLCQDPNRSTHVLQVLLSSRLTNDASLYPASHKHRVIQLPVEAHATLGKPGTDLNALQLALFHRHEGIAFYLLRLIRQHATEKERTLFVNHLWGTRNGSLHLACYLEMPRVVKLLLEMGVKPDATNGKLKVPLNCCVTGKECHRLIEKALGIKEVVVKAAAPLVVHPATVQVYHGGGYRDSSTLLHDDHVRKNTVYAMVPPMPLTFDHEEDDDDDDDDNDDDNNNTDNHYEGNDGDGVSDLM